MAPRVRRDVWKLPAGDKTLEWYGKAVKLLLSRPLTTGNSWRYLAAMHGIDEQLWREAKYLDDVASLPDPPPTAPAWDQCQHQSWYFLPWHRGYLAAFEAIVRDAIVQLGGPQDWALPYWDYNDTSNPKRLEMPPAFAVKTLADGSDNPLYVERRFGSAPGPIVLDPNRIDLRPAMLDHDFPGGDGEGGVSTGFGGPITLFNHGSGTNGLIESEPHNQVHGMVGGVVTRSGRRVFGLMSKPSTAALDPIFWVHHANIDRLWAVWNKRSALNQNPATADWLTGPTDVTFSMPKVDGNSRDLFAKDVLETTAPDLGYTYENIDDPFAGQSRIATRSNRLGIELAATTAGVQKMAKQSELVGVNNGSIKLGANPVDTYVDVDKSVHDKTIKSFNTTLSATAPTEPDRVFLNLENIRGSNDAASFYVYINVPTDADPKSLPDHRVGAVSLFGVEQASRTDGRHAGNGLNQVIEITSAIDKLHIDNALGANQIKVSLVPVTDIQPEDGVSIGRVSVYRQGS